MALGKQFVKAACPVDIKLELKYFVSPKKMFAWNIKCSIFFKIYLFSLCYPGLKPWDITLTLKFHWNIWAAVFVISNLSCNIASTVAPFFWPPICYVWPPFYFRSPKGSFKETWVWGTACFVSFFFFTVVIPHAVRSMYQTLWLRHLSIKDSSLNFWSQRYCSHAIP